MQKVCVYTCITGDYDNLKDINKINVDKNFDYICFTNNKKIESNFWKVIYIENNGLDNLTLARKTKILGNEYLDNYDMTIWMDGAIELLQPFSKFLKDCCDLKKYDMIGFKHRERNCIYDEISACVYFDKENVDNAQILEKFLKKEKYPLNNGLIESTVMIRKNCNDVKKLMNLWYEMLQKYTRRDQLTFNYCLWKEPIKINLLNMNVFNNDYFVHRGHSKDNKSKKIYKVYYGDAEKFEYSKMIKKSYLLENNLFKISFKIHSRSSSIVLKLPDEVGSFISNIKFNFDGDFSLYNFYEIGGNIIFYDDPIVKFNSNFEKNREYIISFNLIDNDKKQIIKILNDKNEIIKSLLYENSILNKNYDNLSIEYNNIINSKSWKFFSKIVKIKHILKRKK